MTPQDTHLMHYLLDYHGIRNLQGSPDLQKFEDTAISIFVNQKYSDINVQDIEGNTFLHYAARANSLIWVEKILRHKADPTILNHEGFNPLRGAHIQINYTPITNKINLDDKFIENTQDFSPEFTQVIFDIKVQGVSSYFKTIDQCNRFLKSANLYSDKNRINLISYNAFVEWEDKISYYLENWDSRENNTHFLRRLISIPEGMKVFDMKMVDQFLERNFQHNDTLREVFNIELTSLGRDGISDHKYAQRVFTKLIQMMFKDNFDFQYKSWGPTIEEDIYDNKIAKKIYLKEKLEHYLEEKEKNSKILKI